jgi:hypothetical protein
MRDEMHDGCDTYLAALDMFRNAAGWVRDELNEQGLESRLTEQDKRNLLDGLLRMLKSNIVNSHEWDEINDE